MQPDHIEKLKSLIERSQLLTDAERGDWLSLLMVMNDKQMAELETILLTHVAAPGPTSHSANIPLGHINNVPEEVVTEKQIPHALFHEGGVNRNTSNDDWLAHLSATLKEKELPAPQPKAPLAAHTSKPMSSLVLKPKVERPVPTMPPVAPKTKVEEPRVPAIAPRAAPTTAELPTVDSIADLSGVEAVGIQTLRASGNRPLGDKLKQCVLQYGYFETLFALEKSPLFVQYLEAGKEMLMNDTKGPSTMTKTEFEIVTDLLRGLQINKQ